MNVLEKLQIIARKGRGMDYQTKERLLRMYGSMKWAFQAPEEVKKNGAEIFLEYYTFEDLSFISKAYKSYVAE